jgi:uncharacterized membrane protein HdeD (DUF308 family)
LTQHLVGKVDRLINMAQEQERYVGVEEKTEGGETHREDHNEHTEKDRKQKEDGGARKEEQERRENYDEERGEVHPHPAVTQAAGGRTYYITIPIRPLSGHVPERYLEKLTMYYTLYGLVFGVVGALAIVLPLCFGLPVPMLLAWLLVLGGSITLLMFLLVCGAPGTVAFFLLSALHLSAGLFLLIKPPSTDEHLTYFIAAWFILHGAIKIFMACSVRKITTWPVVLVSGCVAAVLAFVIVALVPQFGLQLIGIAVGADLAFTGLALLLVSIMGWLGKEKRSVSDADLINEPFLQNTGQP